VLTHVLLVLLVLAHAGALLRRMMIVLEPQGRTVFWQISDMHGPWPNPDHLKLQKVPRCLVQPLCCCCCWLIKLGYDVPSKKGLTCGRAGSCYYQ
jgi:hypothetical protein